MRHAKRKVAFGPAQQDYLISTPQQNTVTSRLNVFILRVALPIALPGDEGRNAISIDEYTIDGQVQMNCGKGGKVQADFGLKKI